MISILKSMSCICNSYETENRQKVVIFKIPLKVFDIAPSKNNRSPTFVLGMYLVSDREHCSVKKMIGAS